MTKNEAILRLYRIITIQDETIDILNKKIDELKELLNEKNIRKK